MIRWFKIIIAVMRGIIHDSFTGHREKYLYNGEYICNECGFSYFFIEADYD